MDALLRVGKTGVNGKEPCENILQTEIATCCFGAYVALEVHLAPNP